MLALAETNCEHETDAKTWARDWRGSGGAFWALAPQRAHGSKGGTARGMVILLADQLGETKATCVWRDPGGE